MEFVGSHGDPENIEQMKVTKEVQHLWCTNSNSVKSAVLLVMTLKDWGRKNAFSVPISIQVRDQERDFQLKLNISILPVMSAFDLLFGVDWTRQLCKKSCKFESHKNGWSLSTFLRMPLPILQSLSVLHRFFELCGFIPQKCSLPALNCWHTFYCQLLNVEIMNSIFSCYLQTLNIKWERSWSL
jgi:hypothetical protein